MGVGNELCTDDAVGMEIVKRLRSSNLANGLEIYPVGGDLLAIPAILAKYETAIVIDALPPGSEPGSLQICEYDLGETRNKGSLSLHDMDLFDCLRSAWETGFGGRIFLIGVTTFCVEPGFGLSHAILNKLEGIVCAVIERITQITK